MSVHTDTAKIRNMVHRMTEAWNAGDATAFAIQFDEDADYITWLGTRDRGREAIEATHRYLFNGPLAGVKMHSGATLDIRYLTPDVALVISDGGQPQHAPQASIITLTAVRHGDTWRIASFQNTRKSTPPAP